MSSKYYKFTVGEYYDLSVTDFDKIKVIPEGQRHRVCRFDDISITNGIIKLYRRNDIHHFEYDERKNMYLLTHISKNKVQNTVDAAINLEAMDKKIEKSENETHDQRIKRFKSTRCNKIFRYFANHRYEIMNVRRFCEIEGVKNPENIRYEVRRIMGIGDVYHISLDELSDILRQFGFVIRKIA